jgi:hypothetical protein
MTVECECCSWQGDARDTGSTGALNGNLNVCPQCGAVDTMEEIEDDEDECIL